ACSPFGAIALAFHETLASALRAEHGVFNGEAVMTDVQNKAEDPRALVDAIDRQTRRLVPWGDSPLAAMGPRPPSCRTVSKHFPIGVVAGVVRRRKGQVPWVTLATL